MVQMSVRKREWITRKGEPRQAWIVDYTDRDGDRHIDTFKRRKDAEARHAEVSEAVRAGVHVAASKSKTVDEAAALWLAGIETRIERATHVDYKGHVERFISPNLGHVKLSDLGLPTVCAFEDSLRKKCSKAMVRKILTTLGTMVAASQERGLVARNVVHDLIRSRKGKRIHEKRHEVKLEEGKDIPSLAEVNAIILHAKPRWRPILVTAAFTGLRASELRGLRWKDVDLKKQVIDVRQRADRFREIGSPKSKAGTRMVPINKLVANTLKELKLASQHDLVFPNGMGNVEDLVNIVKRGLIPAVTAAGLLKDGKPKYTGMHTFRHFYASWCIYKGMTPKVIQTWLGHSSITMTFDRYGHMFPDANTAPELDDAERS
jgi:integrase